MLKLKFVFIYLISCSFLFSQTNGFIVNNQNKPLADASIYIVEHNIILYSDSLGFFNSTQDLPSNVSLEIYKYGYMTKLVNYQPSSRFQVVLEKLHVELDEVGVQETHSVLGNTKYINIEKKDVSSNFLSSYSLVESLSNLPGINLIGSGLGIQKLVLRGLSGLRVVSYLNGMRIENQQWANDHGIGFTSLGLDEVELIKGASALKYGADAVGGMLYFKDKPFIKSDKPSGFISSKFDNSHLLFSNQYGINWSKNNFFANIYAQQSISADYKLPNNFYLFNSRFRNQSIKMSALYIGKKHQSVFRYQHNAEQNGIPAHVHGNLENVNISDLTYSNFSFSDDFAITRPTQFINNHLFIFENKLFYNNSIIHFNIGHFINNLQEYDKWTYPAFDMTMSTSSFKLDVSNQLNVLKISTGVNVLLKSNLNNVNTYLIPNSKENNYGVYSTIDYDKKNLGFNLGLRFDYNNIQCLDYNFDKMFSAFSTSTGLFYKYNDHIIRLTYATSYRPPHLSELFAYGLHHGTNRFEVGLSSLDNEQSHQIDFKYQWSSEHVGLVVNPFFQKLNNFISISPTDSLYEGVYKIYNYTQFNNVEISGIELNLHYHPHFLHNLHLEHSITILNTFNYDNNSSLPLTPANKINSTALVTLDSQNLFRLHSLSLHHIYVFEQSDIVDYESPTNSYNLIDLELYFNPINNMDISFGCKNILNKEYVPHTSRLRGVGEGIPNPGMSFNINMIYNF